MKLLFKGTITLILIIFTLATLLHANTNKPCNCCGQATCTCNIKSTFMSDSYIHNQNDSKTLCCYNTSCKDDASGTQDTTFLLNSSFEEFSKKIVKCFIIQPGHINNNHTSKITDELNPINKHLIPKPSLFPLNACLRL
jgi:hypothetical protein